MVGAVMDRSECSLQRLIRPQAAGAGNRIAVSFADQRWTYAELDAMVTALAGEMSADGLLGQRVALMLPNRLETVVAYLACFLAGAVAAPFNTRYAPPEIERVLRRARPSWLIVDAVRLERLRTVAADALTGVRVLLVDEADGYEPLASLLTGDSGGNPPDVEPGHPAVLFFTSGSTGDPKGVLHTHSSATAVLTSTAEALGDINRDDVIQVCEPLVHVSGFIGTLSTLLAGGRVALYDGFDLDSYVAGLLAHRPTLVCTHIDILAQLVRAPNVTSEWFSSFRGIYTGGDTVPGALQREFMELTGTPIAVGWGMTEAIWLTIQRTARMERDGCIGIPVGGAQVRADAHTGELLVRGPMLMAGYWEDAELTGQLVREGWLHTGDLGWQDPDGVWWFQGRIKDLIVRRTSKITPGEVEAAIDQHSAVAEAAVVAAPDPDEGQVPVAFVVVRRGQELSAPELLAFLRERLAEYKLPARIHFLAALPLTPSGKIAHHDLREPEPAAS